MARGSVRALRPGARRRAGRVAGEFAAGEVFLKIEVAARGRQVEAHFTDGTTLTGEAIGLNEDASLILRTQDGTDHTVRTADVGVL